MNVAQAAWAYDPYVTGISSGNIGARYSYSPQTDRALKEMRDIAAQYAPGGKIYKAMMGAQESTLAKGKRKYTSNIAQQLVSAGLMGTTALPSAELGYEAEVMAPARAQLEAQLAQQYAAIQMAAAQQMAQQQAAAQQMQYGNIQQAAQLAASRPAGGTGFMESAAGDRGFSQDFGISPTTAASTRIPMGGGMISPSAQLPTQTVTPGQPLTGSLLSKSLWESEYGRSTQPGRIEQAYYGTLQQGLPWTQAVLPAYKPYTLAQETPNAASLMYPQQWW